MIFMVTNILVQPMKENDMEWASNLWAKSWNDDKVVSRGKLYHLNDLLGLVAKVGDDRVGLLTFVIAKKELELVTLDSIMEGRGIGTALIDTCLEEAKKKGCKRVWLVTTNDNTEALRFYQRRGFMIHKVYKGAIEKSRKLKPSIPQVGNDGIPIRDEIELEYLLE
jgi:GNAT superfamily N-acetyltransferase